ncbi:MAG: ACT domain-containing protein [Methanosarcinaceae archaeon]|nr:ACT domain-containing protein [Methanosarcinaceae archaeon]
MWSKILSKFKKHPAQEKVVKLLLERGFQVNGQGRVVSGNIELPHTQVAREIGVDRRVVDSTCEVILSDETLTSIFQNVYTIPFLKDVAPALGLGVIVITPGDASKTGILGQVATAVAEYGLSIRQAVTEDPYLTENPLLTIITDDNIPGDLIDELKKVPGVKGVTIY